ncbi:MAG: MBL fold metallo-hydrolase [Chloroflexi bacterium CG_4_10_14_0_8_um_filter_46_9]|nr:MAG: MBL fold metallo-hydrolase [Dehalococcoidia bacterium CG2_30_46_19]PIW40351.1 MAG: MBL fold metallo-hydrolase [Chloroflexi bacterium CG15_BIG_FIL_POST_REV_8_21_14_020_46_15]PIZ27098.1 MAG: MBL fold metallo-hydrolase [Chloroflexi bacterium CG_4_10_14_0_8_um_filter_46_9]
MLEREDVAEIGELDSLKITVLTEDSVLYESHYLGQHGVSFLLEGAKGSDVMRILVDVGQNSQALLNNMKLMNISPSIIDAVVLTHCHYDHTQGVARMLKEIGRKDIRVIAHRDIFRLNFVTEPYLRHVGIMPGDSREEIEKAGGSLLLNKGSVKLMSGITTTGEVKRQTDFEQVGIALKTLEGGEVVDDQMLDDISVVANVSGKGLVIVTGCSHAGIVNIAKHAMELTGCEKIEGIIGGLHLIDAPDDRIKRTVEELSKLNPEWICAGHCTGFKAQVELYLAFRERFSPLQTGMQIEI